MISLERWDGGDFEHGGGAAVGGLFGLPALMR